MPILMDKKLCETTNLCVEIMNSKPRKVMGELGQVVQIRVCRLTSTCKRGKGNLDHMTKCYNK